MKFYILDLDYSFLIKIWLISLGNLGNFAAILLVCCAKLKTFPLYAWLPYGKQNTDCAGIILLITNCSIYVKFCNSGGTIPGSQSLI